MKLFKEQILLRPIHISGPSVDYRFLSKASNCEYFKNLLQMATGSLNLLKL